MSGVEVAGLILGAIPLIIEGYDRSQKAFVAFDTYRHYPKELTKLDAKIAITNDRSMVHAMLSEPSHAGWQDEEIQRTLAARLNALDESFVSCQRTMDQIHQTLRDICRETGPFQTVLVANNKGEQQQAVGNREWYRRLEKRIKLSLNKPQIEAHIEELRNFNSDFNLMSNQIISSINDTTARNSTAITQMSRALPSLLRYKSVRKASQWLHETLVNRWSCSHHSHHSANISLNSEVEEPPTVSVLQPESFVTVRLEMAITYYTGSLTGEAPIWLKVESSVDVGMTRKVLPGLQSFQDVSAALQSRTGSFIAEPKGPQKSKTKPKRSVRFDSDPSAQLQTLSLSPVLPAPLIDERSLDERSLDLCLIPDVCEHFQSRQRNSQQQFCMGYLNDTCVQRFYQPPAERCLNGKPKSLEDIIVWISEDPIRILPRSIVFQLAASLATAVLRYHSTPWLQEVWRSRDIVFFGIEDFQQGNVSLCYPHLNVEFSRYKGKRKAAIELESEGSASTSAQAAALTRATERTTLGARNEVLFHLGLVLLELGFATPWPTLRASILKTLPDKNATDYIIADKLARLLVNSMGPKYSKIIRKCLGCDFGLGETDLASDELQEQFLLEVVVALKGLQERFPAT